MYYEIKNATEQFATYGSYKPVSFNDNIRYDEYRSFSTGNIECIEPVLALNNNDLSPVKIERATVEEREKCHCCFAGYAHTVALCNNRNKK